MYEGADGKKCGEILSDYRSYGTTHHVPVEESDEDNVQHLIRRPGNGKKDERIAGISRARIRIPLNKCLFIVLRPIRLLSTD
jgi:hypothetical protein